MPVRDPNNPLNAEVFSWTLQPNLHNTRGVENINRNNLPASSVASYYAGTDPTTLPLHLQRAIARDTNSTGWNGEPGMPAQNQQTVPVTNPNGQASPPPIQQTGSPTMPQSIFGLQDFMRNSNSGLNDVMQLYQQNAQSMLPMQPLDAASLLNMLNQLASMNR